MHDSFAFTNSDPTMITVFLKLLRKSFDLDEEKLRVYIHLHTYHDPEVQLKFWSKITHIPRSQFKKIHIKKTSGMYKKEGYEGCITINYYDIAVKRILLGIFKKLIDYI